MRFYDHPFFTAERTSVRVLNRTARTLPAWNAGKLGVLLHSTKENGPDLYDVTAAVNDNGIWGILSSTLPPDGIGNLILTGVVPAHVPIDADGHRVRPGSDGRMIRTDSSRALALTYSRSDGTPGAILLGEVNGLEYNGQFKITRTDTGFKVVHGAAETRSWCGETDVPGCTFIPAFAYTVSDPDSYDYVSIWLHVTRTGNRYQAGFVTSAPSDGLKQYIGRISSTDIDQSWTGGNIYFSREYFL